MKKNTILLVALGLTLLSIPVFSQTPGWTSQTTKDGLTTVVSRISQVTDPSGKSVPLIEFKATTIVTIAFDRCVALMKDPRRHGPFVDSKESLLVKTLSKTEWVVYYNFNTVWPLPGSDVAATMVLVEDPVAKSATFTLTAAPDLYPIKKDVARMTSYLVSYGFRDLGDGRVEFVTTAKNSPAMQVPDWMIKAYFPEGPAETQKLFLAQARS